MIVMPSDHYIPDTEAFADMVEKGASNLRKGQIICFGVTPDKPETGYGYIRIHDENNAVKPVLAFTEKPDSETAETFIGDGGYLWNAGIFMMRARELLDVAAEIQPLMLSVARKAVMSATKDLDFLRLDAVAWQDMPADSFDYAFMEKAKIIGLGVGLKQSQKMRASTPKFFMFMLVDASLSRATGTVQSIGWL